MGRLSQWNARESIIACTNAYRGSTNSWMFGIAVCKYTVNTQIYNIYCNRYTYAMMHLNEITLYTADMSTIGYAWKVVRTIILHLTLTART